MAQKTITVYGIPACDTVRKVRAWLDLHGMAYAFHDYKKQGVPEELLRSWVKSKGWEVILNRKGTTFKTLDAAIQKGVTNPETAVQVMLKFSSTIKRPIVMDGEELVCVGFDELSLATLG